jgi:hypothetical protein
MANLGNLVFEWNDEYWRELQPDVPHWVFAATATCVVRQVTIA